MGRLLPRLTTAPEGGAAPSSASVPVDDEPPITVLGFNVSEISDAGFTVSDVFRVVT